MIPKKILSWLLEPTDPSVRYRTLVDLLNTPLDDERVYQCLQAIKVSHPVNTIFSKMHPDGYWLQKNPRTKKIVGDGVVYGSFATTHFCLSYLAELGLTRDHPLVEKAAERYLNLQMDDGDFWNHFSCLLGFNIRTFVLLGYGDDHRVKKTINLLLRTKRADGGYLCDMHEGKYKTRPVKSCIRGSVKVLYAFSYLPWVWHHPRCQEVVSYFLRRDGIFRTDDLHKVVNFDFERLSFPITWRANIFEVLIALEKMGYGRDKRLTAARDLLLRKQKSDGRFCLDWTPSQSPWNVGTRNKENKWVTLYAYQSLQYANDDKK